MSKALPPSSLKRSRLPDRWTIRKLQRNRPVMPTRSFCPTPDLYSGKALACRPVTTGRARFSLGMVVLLQTCRLLPDGANKSLLHHEDIVRECIPDDSWRCEQ